MNPTLIRSFQKTSVRLSDAATGTSYAKWSGYFMGITGLLLVGAAGLYKLNEENNISKNFKREGLNKVKA